MLLSNRYHSSTLSATSLENRMKRLLATGIISVFMLSLAPVAQAAEPTSVCAYITVEVNGDRVVDEGFCQFAT